MSDRRPKNPTTIDDLRVIREIEQPEGVWKIADPATTADLLAAVREGVESGTIKGEVRRYCEKHEALVGAIPHLCNVANWVIDGGGSPTDCRINDALVVSDGGGSCDGSGTCEATDHIEGCYRSTYVRPVSDGGSET